jgi:hypothetical protein
VLQLKTLARPDLIGRKYLGAFLVEPSGTIVISPKLFVFASQECPLDLQD